MNRGTYKVQGEEFFFEMCAGCGVIFAAPQRLIDGRRENRDAFYCPNGHVLRFGETEADRLRRERDALKQEQARLIEERDAALRDAATARDQENARHITRARVGVCPCCHRSFAELRRHMQTKHPEHPLVLDAPKPLKRLPKPLAPGRTR